MSVEETHMHHSYVVIKKSLEPAKISVILPTFRRWDFLFDAIKSVFQQTFSDWEIVIVNDGGGKPEGKVNELLRHPRITYVEHVYNRGLPAARNTGILCSSGEFIAYLDDDDVFYPSHLETLFKVLTKNGCEVAYTDAYKAIYDKNDGNYYLVAKLLEYSFDFEVDRMWRDNFIPVICIAHNRNCLEKIGAFDTTLKALEDWDLWLRMSVYYVFHHIPSVTAEYRVRQDKTNMTTATSSDVWDMTKMMIFQKYLSNPRHIPNSQIHAFVRKRVSCFARKNCQKLVSRSSGKTSDLVNIDFFRYMIPEDWLKMFFKFPLLTMFIKAKQLIR